MTGSAFVYRCKDVAGVIVYVGWTKSHPIIRLRSHRLEHQHRLAGRRSGEPWYHLMASVDWAEIPTPAQAQAEEQRQIDIHNPLGNVLGRPVRVRMVRRSCGCVPASAAAVPARA